MALNQKVIDQVESPSQISDMVEELGTASRLPNLSRDVAASLALLFIVIVYHIQHPFLLFRVEFGQTFRDVQQQGFQEAIVYALLASSLLLMSTWHSLRIDRDIRLKLIRNALIMGYGLALLFSKVADPLVPIIIFAVLLLAVVGKQSWADRQRPHDRLRLALVVGLGLYLSYVIVLIFKDSNIFLNFYDLKAEGFVDTLSMRRSEAATFTDTVKSLNSMAVLGGAGCASLLYLWAPWESVRFYALGQADRNQSLLRYATDIMGLLAIGLWFLTYRLVNPIWRYNSQLGQDLSDQKSLLGIFFVASVVALVTLQLRLYQPREFFATVWSGRTLAGLTDYRRIYRRLQAAVALGAVLYALLIGVALVAESNLVQDYYNVDDALYAELFAEPERIEPLKATDWPALLAGIAFISILYFWSPWERLAIYVDVFRGNLAAVVVAILAVVAWETSVNVFNIQQFLLPKPSVIWDKFLEIYPGLIAGSWFTVKNALEGFAIGCGAGIFTGILSARFIRFSRAILPLAVAANAVPIIAFAPISNAWFGLTNPDAKIAIVAVLCYFPAMISTVQGLTSIEARELELMKSYAASEFEIFRHLRWPTALPFIFSSLKLAATLAMIGAIVAEFFGGTPATALGFRIKNDAGLLRMTETWSAIIIASVLGIGFFLFISALERNAMPWYGSFRNDSR